jgi:hypothetical protein
MVTPPIIVIDGHDFSFYESEEAVDHHLEPWYPEEEHLAFDSEGRELELVVETRTAPRRLLPDRSFEWVGVRTVEDRPTHSDELASLLREHLELAGINAPVDASLGELLDRAIERSGYT